MKILNIIPALATVALLVACGGNRAAGGDNAAAAGNDTVQTVVDFNADSAYRYVKTQCDFGPRVPGTPAHSQCGTYIESQLRKSCDQVIVQQAPVTTFDGKRLNAVNYIGVVNPDATQRILLVAHWDCRPWADNDPDPAKRKMPVMGANDAASGTAVLLELARLMKSRKPAIGVDFLITDAEDWGTDSNEESWALGTQYWAAHPHVDGYRPMYGILLDMVGAKGATFMQEGFSIQVSQPLVDAIWDTAEKSGYGKFFVAKSMGSVNDDHVPINRAGITCIDIIDMRPETEAGFFKHWHTTSDTMEHIDPATLKAVGQTIANFIYSI